MVFDWIPRTNDKCMCCSKAVFPEFTWYTCGMFLSFFECDDGNDGDDGNNGDDGDNNNK